MTPVRRHLRLSDASDPSAPGRAFVVGGDCARVEPRERTSRTTARLVLPPGFTSAEFAV